MFIFGIARAGNQRHIHQYLGNRFVKTFANTHESGSSLLHSVCVFCSPTPSRSPARQITAAVVSLPGVHCKSVSRDAVKMAALMGPRDQVPAPTASWWCAPVLSGSLWGRSTHSGQQLRRCPHPRGRDKIRRPRGWSLEEAREFILRVRRSGLRGGRVEGWGLQGGKHDAAGQKENNENRKRRDVSGFTSPRG